jgi:predicted dehydrogenase
MSSRRAFLSQVATGIGSLASVPRNVLGANDRIRVGVIGYGDRGSALAREAQQCGNVEVVAVADVYKGRLESAAGEFPGLRTGSDYRTLLEDGSVDAVVVATPPHLHAQQFVSGLAAGKHVYVEAPMAFTTDDAKRMRAAYAAARGKLAVQVGHQSCSYGHVSDASRFLTAEQIGVVTAIQANMHRNTPRGRPHWARPVYPDMTEENIAWTQFLGNAPALPFDAARYRNWRYFWDYSAGGISEYMSHQVAFWYKVLNLQIPYAVSTTGGHYLWPNREVPDTVNVSMDQAENLLFTWHSTFGNANAGMGESVLGTEGTITRAAQIRYWPEKVNGSQASPLSGSTPTAPGAHVRNWIESVYSGNEPTCNVDLGYRVSIACSMAVESYHLRRTVYWDSAADHIA